MDGIIGLGHFCETHGPCIILSTQKYMEKPQQKPHSLIVPWCEACQSLQTDQAFLSRGSQQYYVTSRTPLLQNDAFLLRQAAVRSLSCEQEGSLYFGDNERGHVYSYSFNVHDTLARGFWRKYCILVLMQDKLTLLSCWSMMFKHIKDIAIYIAECANVVSQMEQVDKSEKFQRQLESSPSTILRSLMQLTTPGIYAHLHLWFAWVLGCPIAIEKSQPVTPLNLPVASSYLRIMYQEMGDVFSAALMHSLHGFIIQCDEPLVVEAFKSIWPRDSSFLHMSKNPACILVKKGCHWSLESTVDLNSPKSMLQRDLESVLGDNRVSEATLVHQISALVMSWIHNVNMLLVCPEVDVGLLKSMNITKNDVQLLSFIMSSHSRCEQLVAFMNNAFDIK